MFLVVVFFRGRLPCKFHRGSHGDVLVLFQAGYHKGMTERFVWLRGRVVHLEGVFLYSYGGERW